MKKQRQQQEQEAAVHTHTCTRTYAHALGILEGVGFWARMRMWLRPRTKRRIKKERTGCPVSPATNRSHKERRSPSSHSHHSPGSRRHSHHSHHSLPANGCGALDFQTQLRGHEMCEGFSRTYEMKDITATRGSNTEHALTGG